MAKYSNKDKKKEEEIIEDADYSSEDIKVYKPSKKNLKEINENEDLVMDEDDGAYNSIQYIDLEWPAHSIDIVDSKIFLGTCPNPENTRAKSELVQIDLKYTDFERLNYKKKEFRYEINKLRINKYIFALSDNYLSKLDLNLNLICQVKGNYGFALYISKDFVLAGTLDGYVECYDNDLKELFKFKAHDKSIETIAYDNDLIFTGSNDHSLKIFNKKGELIEKLDNKSDVNCLDVRNGKLVFGDDDGNITLYTMNTKVRECIEWHTTPISLIRWRDDEIFASGSDEQVCLWDITLEDEDEEQAEFSKYLLFVHQGQKFYKDCCFEDKKVIVTAFDGICVFEPISLNENQ